jgi:hypothetical protein
MENPYHGLMELKIIGKDTLKAKSSLGTVKCMTFAPKQKILFVCGDDSPWIQMYDYNDYKFKGMRNIISFNLKDFLKDTRAL